MPDTELLIVLSKTHRIKPRCSRHKNFGLLDRFCFVFLLPLIHLQLLLWSHFRRSSLFKVFVVNFFRVFVCQRFFLEFLLNDTFQTGRSSKRCRWGRTWRTCWARYCFKVIFLTLTKKKTTLNLISPLIEKLHNSQDSRNNICVWIIISYLSNSPIWFWRLKKNCYVLRSRLQTWFDLI